ncbi:MAG: hypothetical protein ACLS7Z_03095 [Christensenellales bacterium]
MNQAWYQVASMGFGYLSAAIIALIVLLAFKKYAQDRALWRRVKRNLPQAGAAGRFIVLSAGSRRLPAGTGCACRLSARRIDELRCLRAAKRLCVRPSLGWAGTLCRCIKTVFWPPKRRLSRAARPSCATARFCASAGETVVRMYDRGELADGADEPYVTSARRSKAGQGRGDGLGAPTRGAIRREKKKLN